MQESLAIKQAGRVLFSGIFNFKNLLKIGDR